MSRMVNTRETPPAAAWISRCNGVGAVPVSAAQAAIDLAHARALHQTVTETVRPDGTVAYAWTVPAVVDTSAASVAPAPVDRRFSLEPVPVQPYPKPEPTEES